MRRLPGILAAIARETCLREMIGDVVALALMALLIWHLPLAIAVLAALLGAW